MSSLVAAFCALLVVALLLGASLAWLVAGRALRPPRHLSPHGLDAQAALRRHPAGRARWGDPDIFPQIKPDTAVRPVGPDDDQEFLDRLERQIRGGTDSAPGN